MKHKMLIVGTGVTGKSVMRFLKSLNISFDVYEPNSNNAAIDQLKTNYPNAHFYLNDLTEINWDLIGHVTVSPGISPTSEIIYEAEKRAIPIACDLELFAQAQKLKPIIAITGTNGKSTLVTIVASILKDIGLNVALAGNIGQAMLDTLTHHDNYDVWVLELSSFQLHYQNSLKATISCILNISEDHIDWHGSYEAYQQAKHKIYSQSEKQIFNEDDPLTKPQISSNINSFSLSGSKKSKFRFDGINFYENDKPLFNTSNLKLSGTHNYEDILAALAIVDAFNLNIKKCIPAIKKFEGLEHRTQLVRKINNIEWINDSKGTNVGATLAALKGISSAHSGKIIWLAGGKGKGADFSPLKETILTVVRHAILFGEDKEKIAECINEKVPITYVKSMSEAVKLAQEYAIQNDCVLLSPACSSFDMFKNYQERGDIFAKLVHQIN